MDRQQTKEEQRPRSFNPHDHLIQLKSKQGSQDYLPVQFRLVWFRECCPEGEISTEMVHLDLDREMEEETFAWNNETRRSEKVVKRALGFVIFRATVKDGKGGIATGTKSEKAASFPDYIEKAESGSIGRALAALGYGTQFVAGELDEGHRIADAPVDRSGSSDGASRKSITSVHPSVHTQQATVPVDGKTPVTDQQITSIRKLCQTLGKPEPETIEKFSFVAARKLIEQLSQEYRQQRSHVISTIGPVSSEEEQPASTSLTEDLNAPATEQQKASILKLAHMLKKDVDEPETYLEAKTLIATLSKEYNESKKAS